MKNTHLGSDGCVLRTARSTSSVARLLRTVVLLSLPLKSWSVLLSCHAVSQFGLLPKTRCRWRNQRLRLCCCRKVLRHPAAAFECERECERGGGYDSRFVRVSLVFRRTQCFLNGVLLVATEGGLFYLNASVSQFGLLPKTRCNCRNHRFRFCFRRKVAQLHIQVFYEENWRPRVELHPHINYLR